MSLMPRGVLIDEEENSGVNGVGIPWEALYCYGKSYLVSTIAAGRVCLYCIDTQKLMTFLCTKSYDSLE